jgi:polar amino acid transport system substrate-binding protein
MRGHVAWLLTLAALLATGPRRGAADAPPPAIRAVAGIIPPAVMEENGRLTGFSIDLWNEVARRLGSPTAYQVVHDADSAFQALREGDADVAVSGSFYTVERDRDFDFTYPILDAGLQVMVRGASTEAEDPSVLSFLRVVLSRSMLYWLATALALVVVPAHVIWFLDRRMQGGVGTSERYFPGIFHAVEWAVAGLLGQVALMPRQGLARLLAHLWLFAGVVFVAFFTAQMTTRLTVERFRGVIHGPADLPGKSVATVEGTSAVPYLRGVGARVREFPGAAEMFSALASGEVDAVVTVAPILRYYATHEGAGRVRIAGPEFQRGYLAFVVPLGSPLRRRIDGALVAIREDGAYQRIHEKWFGKEE